LSGFESTHIFGSKKDVLELTKHTEFFEQDLRLVNRCGLICCDIRLRGTASSACAAFTIGAGSTGL
jgi:hypothetical protein